jgi:hypothetical protein
MSGNSGADLSVDSFQKQDMVERPVVAVSIVIPTKNTGRSSQQTLDAIQAQEVTLAELV